MNSPTISSTQQQDQVARSNSTQARRHGADQKSQLGPSAFADLLQQATEPADDADSADLLTDRALTETRDGAPGTSDGWLALAQAYHQAPRAAETAATAATDSDAPASVAASADAPDTPVSTADVRPTDTDPVPELDAEARAEAAETGPRRPSGKGAAKTTVGTGIGAPATRQDAAAAPSVTAAGAATSVTATAASGLAAVMAPRADTRAPVAAGQVSPEGVGETAPTLLPATGAERSAVARDGSGAPQTDVQAGADGAPTERSRDAEAPQPDTPAWDQQWGEAMEDLGHQVSYWLGRGVRQAHIQVGAGLERPIEVAVTLDNGQAVLHFQTDSATTRAAIESGAAEALRHALARDGIGLAGLSVGSQDRQSQQGADGQPGRRAWRLDGAGDVAPTQATAPMRPPGNRVLDLYA